MGYFILEDIEAQEKQSSHVKRHCSLQGYTFTRAFLCFSIGIAIGFIFSYLPFYAVCPLKSRDPSTL